MRAGIATLIAAYVLSQFYRACLAVLAPVLAAALDAQASDLAAASGYWFLSFAFMQIPVGILLDRIGPKRTSSALLAIGGAGGAFLFALATTPAQIGWAMALIGLGCSPVLMASYYTFARGFSPEVFGTLAGMTVGIGSLGNIGASLPLSFAVDALGWRATLIAVGVITLCVAALLFIFVRDPEPDRNSPKGSLFDLIKMPQLWPIMAMMLICYAPAAGIRGLWIGPYYRDVFGADGVVIGQVSLLMGIAMVLGSFAYGPLERVFGSRKWLLLSGNLLALACLIGLALVPQMSGVMSAAFLIGVGFFGASFPMVIAHGRAFIPPHLLGRGVTLLNLFGIGATGLLQLATGAIYAAAPAQPYMVMFGFIATCVAIGLLIYTFSQDRTD